MKSVLFLVILSIPGKFYLILYGCWKRTILPWNGLSAQALVRISRLGQQLHNSWQMESVLSASGTYSACGIQSPTSKCGSR